MRIPNRFCFTLALAACLTGVAGSTWSTDQLATLAVPWPTTAWQASAPEAQGMASDALRRVVEYGAQNEMDSLLVVRHGKLVVDAYYAPYRADVKHSIYSATKAVVGTLTGIAVKDGLLQSISQPAMNFFHDQPVAAVDADRRNAIHIEHLLDMTSGISWDERFSNAQSSSDQMRLSPNWTHFVLDRPVVRAPGASFDYNTGNAHLLSAILSKVTGASAAEFATQRLFKPLGISDFVWTADPQGISDGGSGLYMYPRDMAKFGYLYLHNGEWQGQALLPPEWTDKVFHHATADMQLDKPSTLRFANGWWTKPDRHLIIAVGRNTDLILVLPELDLVAVVTGKSVLRFGALVNLLEAAAVSDLALPANPKSFAELTRAVRGAATEKASPVPPTPAMARKISGRVYRFERNAQGLSTLRLDLTAANPQYELDFNPGNPLLTGSIRLTGPVGLHGLFRTNENGVGPLRAVKAYWTDSSTLSLDSQWLSDGISDRYSLRFGDNAVDAEYTDSHGEKVQRHGVSVPLRNGHAPQSRSHP